MFNGFVVLWLGLISAALLIVISLMVNRHLCDAAKERKRKFKAQLRKLLPKPDVQSGSPGDSNFYVSGSGHTGSGETTEEAIDRWLDRVWERFERL